MGLHERSSADYLDMAPKHTAAKQEYEIGTQKIVIAVFLNSLYAGNDVTGFFLKAL